MIDKQKTMSDDLVKIAAFSSPVEASLVRAELEAAGIPARLDGEMMAGWFWHYGSALGGVKLLVKYQDLERAQKLLSSYADRKDGNIIFPAQEGCEEGQDQTESDTLYSSGQSLRAWRASVIGMCLFPPLLNVYSMWLLIRHGLLVRSGRRKIDGYSYAALLVNLFVFGVVGIIILSIFAPSILNNSITVESPFFTIHEKEEYIELDPKEEGGEPVRIYLEKEGGGEPVRIYLEKEEEGEPLRIYLEREITVP